MKRLAVSLAVCAAVMTGPIMPLQVQAQEGPRVFQRSGSWSLDAGEDSCRLARTFSDGTDTIAFAMERNRADNFVRLILVGDAVRTYRAADQIGYSYVPANDQRSARYIRSETPDGQAYFNLGNLVMGPSPLTHPIDPDAAVRPYDRAAEQEFAAGVTAIDLNEGLARAIRLETGSLGAPIEALQRCTDDLLGFWGLDWEQHQTMTRRAAPVGMAYEWMPANIVGPQDLAAFGGARNPFRVMVGADGKPISCTVHWPSLDERKNQQICDAIMENGNFTPALDADGQPMASYWMADFFPALSRPFGR